jgi:hypothetical protein
MSRTTRNSIAIACGLALSAAAFSATAFARGGGGGGSGHSSSGMSHSGRSMSAPQNFSRSTPNSHMSGTHMSSPHMSNSHPSTSHMSSQHPSKSAAGKQKFVSNKFQKQTMHKFAHSHSKSPYWRKYGWGFGGPWGLDFGWGWGCWDSPWSYGWSWYDPLPVADYSNPYCDCAGTVVDGVDYSAPISRMPANTVEGDDSDAFAAARQAFLEGNVDAALNAISVAALQMPQNQDMHQFHSLVLFAKGDYCRSATVAHVVLQEGPGWSWNTLQGFYPSPEIYTAQLRGLEHYVNDHPDEANARFLLGYHYLMMNHGDAGQRQMQQVLESQPKDRLAQSIVTGMSHSAAAKLAAAKEEDAKPAPDNNVPDNTVPDNNNSGDQETVVQSKTKPAKTTAVQTTPMDDKKTDKATTVDDADNTPANGKSPKIVDKPAPDQVPGEGKSDDNKSDSGKADNGKSNNTATDDDKPPADEKSDQKPAKAKVNKPVPDAKPDRETTDDSDKPPAKSKPNKAAANDNDDQPPADSAKTSAKAKPVTLPDDNSDDSATKTVPTKPARPKNPKKRPKPASGLNGTFKASPEKGIQIELTLGPDQAFVWKFTANGKTQKFAGKYKMGPNSLSLIRSDGEAMDGTFERAANGGFKFRMKGAEADDPGLTFAR